MVHICIWHAPEQAWLYLPVAMLRHSTVLMSKHIGSGRANKRSLTALTADCIADALPSRRYFPPSLSVLHPLRGPHHPWATCSVHPRAGFKCSADPDHCRRELHRTPCSKDQSALAPGGSVLSIHGIWWGPPFIVESAYSQDGYPFSMFNPGSYPILNLIVPNGPLASCPTHDGRTASPLGQDSSTPSSFNESPTVGNNPLLRKHGNE